MLDILDADEEYNDELEGYLLKGDNVSFLATYFIDEDETVFHKGVNHMPVGRNVNEFLRMIDAYTHVQKNGEVCPANWEEGEEAMTADRLATAAYLSQN